MKSASLWKLNRFFCVCLLFATAPVGAVDDVRQIAIEARAIDEAFKTRRISLLLGVQKFDDTRFRELRFPIKDVNDIKRFLTTHNSVERDEQIVLANEDATTTSFIAALDELERRNTSADDIVLVYLSTHGTIARENVHSLKRYAVMRDTVFTDVSATGISIDYIQNRLSRLKSTRKALVLALCHSGTGKSQLPSAIQKELTTMKAGFFPQPLHEVSSAMMVLSAASWGQPAREDDFLENDIYTHFLLEGLRKNDANGDGGISLFEAHEFARSRTYDFTRGQQTPSALLNLEGTDPIILNGKVRRRSHPMLFADSDRFRDLKVLVNGRTKGSLWQPKVLKPGRVRLTLVDPRNPATPLMDHHLYLRRDKVYPVSTLFRRPPAIAAEIHGYNLPLPDGLDRLSQADYWSPGIVARGSEVMGLALVSGLGYFHKNMQGQTDLELSSAAVNHQVDVWRAFFGYGFYPAETINLSLNIGIERLHLVRTISDATIDRPTQSSTLVYPMVSVEARWLEVVESFYAGAGLTGYPARKVGFEVNDQLKLLRAYSGSGVVGFSF